MSFACIVGSSEAKSILSAVYHHPSALASYGEHAYSLRVRTLFSHVKGTATARLIISYERSDPSNMSLVYFTSELSSILREYSLLKGTLKQSAKDIGSETIRSSTIVPWIISSCVGQLFSNSPQYTLPHNGCWESSAMQWF